MVLMRTAVEMEDVDDRECVTVLIAIKDDSNLIKHDDRVDFGDGRRHCFVDNELGSVQASLHQPGELTLASPVTGLRIC